MTLSLYNKYRPQVFGDVVGQQHVEHTLANAVEKNKTSHAYLFCGPRGTGKTTTARILAKALLCKQAPTATPCGMCTHCEQIAEGIHPDVYELDAASRTGVDNVREEIIGRVNFAPTHGTHKIYIIDEVHMLSTAAFNALLKTLEEPPPHVVFVLCTTDVHKVPDTVQARCQRFDFKRLTVTEIRGRLQYICEREGFDVEQGALELIARRSAGGMRDAIRSLEQVAVFGGSTVSYAAAESMLGMVDEVQIFELCEALASGNAASCFDWVASFVQSGSDIAILVGDLATHVRNLYVVSVSGSHNEQLASALEVSVEALGALHEQAALFGSPDRLAYLLTVLGSLSAELRNAANARLALEVALTRILRPAATHSLEALEARVAALESALGGSGGGAAAGAGAGLGSSAGAGPGAGADRTQGQPQPAQSASAPAEGEQAPQSMSVPIPAAAASVSALDASQPEVHRLWYAAVDAVRKEKATVAASLGGIEPQLNEQKGRLTLEMPANAGSSKDFVEMPANRSLIEAAVAKVFGGQLTLSFVLAAGEVAAQGRQAAASSATAASPEASAASFNAQPAAQPTAGSAAATATASAATASAATAVVANQENTQGEPSQSTNATTATAPSAPAPNTVTTEPSKRELDNILSASTGSTLSFQEL